MKTKLLKSDEVVLGLSFAEVELLYDGLDALNDRYERYADDGEGDEKAKAEKDLVALGKLNEEFQDAVNHVRRPRFGTQLPNGAIVIEVRGNIILAKNNCGTRDEYVTWKYDGRDLHSTSFGHYHRSLTDAVMDFIDRTEPKGG